MAEIIRHPITQIEDVSARIDVNRDDYSIKASSPSDRIFWIRIEIPVQDEVIVSDFNAGSLGDEVLIFAFLKIADELPSDVRTFVFKDVAPGPASLRSGMAISAAHSRIGRCAERLARKRKRKVHRVSLEESRGKVNVRVQLI